MPTREGGAVSGIKEVRRWRVGANDSERRISIVLATDQGAVYGVHHQISFLARSSCELGGPFFGLAIKGQNLWVQNRTTHIKKFAARINDEAADNIVGNIVATYTGKATVQDAKSWGRARHAAAEKT